jgi:hypothetical protein
MSGEEWREARIAIGKDNGYMKDWFDVFVGIEQ